MNAAIDTELNDNEPTAPGQLNEEELVAEISANLKEARKHWAKWRTEARECYDFFAGEQWDDADKAKLMAEDRPPVTFNRIARTINAVAGLELQNRQEVRFTPREKSDTGVSEMLTQSAKWARDNTDAEDEESEAFQDTLICGIGCTDTHMDYEVDPEGKIIIERIDPMEMLFDHNSKKRNFADGQWIARIKEISQKEFKATWPGAEAMPGKFWSDSAIDPHDATEAMYYRNDQSDKLLKGGSYTIVQYQWWERLPVIKALDPSMGKIVEISPEKLDAISAVMESRGQKLDYVKVNKRVYRQAFLCGSKLLEPVKGLGCSHFTFQPTTGLRDRNKGTWFGLVKLMQDPQRWANKWLSQIQHIVNTGAKNGLIAEEDAIPNPVKFEEEYALPGSLSIVRPGAISQGKIMPKEAPRYPDGVDRLLQYALEAVNDVPGVSLELIGLADRDQPIGLEESRKKAGMVILANFFDSLRRYRKEQGRVLAYFIKEYISDGRLVRIVGDQGAQYVPLLKDQLTYEYDIIVDDAPTSPNMKEKVFMLLQKMLPMMLQAGIPVPPDILDYAPIPDALAQKWKQMITASSSDPLADQMKQIQMMLAQLEVEQKQADIQKTNSEVTANYAKAEQAHAIGQDESAQAMQKMGLGQAEHQMKLEQLQKDQARKDLEMLLNQRRKAIESQMNAKIKAQQQASMRQ